MFIENPRVPFMKSVSQVSAAMLGIIIGVPGTSSYSVTAPLVGWKLGGLLYDWSHPYHDLTFNEKAANGDWFNYSNKPVQVNKVGDYSFRKIMVERRRRSTSSAGSGRSVRRRVSRKRVARRTKIKIRRSSQKLKKQIKSGVQSVLMCKENIGIYTKTYTGEIEPYVNAGQERVAFSMTRNQANAPPYSADNMRFCLTRQKILDAASVLYNNKSRSIDWNATVGNFDIKGLKVESIYSAYHVKVWNYTEYPHELEIWEVTNKYNTNQHFIEDISEMHKAQDWVASIPAFTSAASTWYDIARGLDFNMIKGVARKYDIKRVKKGIIMPGLGITHRLSFGKLCLDYEKDLVNVATVGTLPKFAKGDKQIVFRYTPVMHLNASTTKHICTNLANVTSVDHGFLVDVKEVYKVMQPAETDDAYVGDRRCIFDDTPYVPDGVGPYVQKFMSTGPTFTNITNPST